MKLKQQTTVKLSDFAEEIETNQFDNPEEVENIINKADEYRGEVFWYHGDGFPAYSAQYNEKKDAVQLKFYYPNMTMRVVDKSSQQTLGSEDNEE